MKIKLQDGTYLHHTVLDCTGHVARSITFTAHDFNWMVHQFNSNPDGFRTWLHQMQARFAINRVTMGTSGTVLQSPIFSESVETSNFSGESYPPKILPGVQLSRIFRGIWNFCRGIK